MKSRRAYPSPSSVDAFFAVDNTTPREPVDASFDFFALYLQCPFSIVIYDPEGHCVMANEAFLRQWDISFDQLPRDYSVLRDPQLEKAGILPLIRRVFAGEGVVVLPPVHYDSSIFSDLKHNAKWFQGTLSPIFDAEHNLKHVIHLHTDISLQVQEQLDRETQGERDNRLLREIQQSTLNFYDIYEQLPLSAVTFDTRGRVLIANLAYTREWGITVDQLPADYSILHDAQMESSGVMPILQRAFAGETIELPPLQYDIGSVVSGVTSSRWFRGIFHPVRDDLGVIRQIVAIHTDVTEQENTRLAVQAHAAHEERLVRETLECTTDGVIHVDRNWNYLYLNKTAIDLVSVGRQLVGKNMWEEFPGAVYGKMWVAYHKTMYERVAAEAEEFYGEPLNMWLHVRSFPTTEGVAIFFRDITEHRRTEKALRDNEKLVVVGRLAASIAHEINNPLESVANLLYLLQSEPGMSRNALQYVDLAQQELRRVALITINTLKFFRQPAAPSQGSILEIIGSVLTLFQGRLRQNNVRIQTRYRAHAEFTCYAAELRQVFANFLGNAIDATPSGGSISLRVRPTADACHSGPGILVTIADTGCGMSAHTIAHLYEAFFTTKEIMGTGLGLWVSAELIHKHAGCVRGAQP